MIGRRAGWMLTAAAVTGISLCLYWSGAAAALWNSGQAVHINAKEIENSTLAIGTHLIHLGALTEELYNIAQKSAEDSMQGSVFYKSELAGGTWFDITSASGLEDISTGGTPVTEEEIEKLYFEYHTKSDGVTYDLRTQKPVNIFDIRDPYDLEAMEELQPVKIQYDMLVEKGKLENKDQWCKDRMTEFFQVDTSERAVVVVDEETGESTVYAGGNTKELDRRLSKLQDYLNVLNQYDAGSSEKDEVSAVMASVDASRRLIVYEIVYDMTYQLMETYTGANGQLPEGYQVDAGLTDAVNEALGNLNEAIIETGGNVRAEGDTVLSMEIYRWSNQLIEDAKAGNMAACDMDVEKLLALKNITDGTIEKQQAELELLDGSLLSTASARYRSGLGGGENSEYLTAKAGNAAGVMLDSIAGKYGNLVNTFRNELEFLVDAKCMRLDNTAGQEYVKNCIEEASGYYGGILSDGFYDSCKQSLDGYLQWLNDKLSSLVQGGGGTEADSLKAEKEELQEQYMAALDKNNLEKAQELEKKISAADEKIKALDSAQAAEYVGLESEIAALKEELEAAAAEGRGTEIQEALARELSGKQAQAADLKSRMSGESAGIQAVKIKQEAMDAVTKNPGEAELAQVGGAIDALGGMLDTDYKAVFPQLTQIYSQMTRERDLNGSGAYDDLIEKTEELILNNKSAYDAAMKEQVTSDAMTAAAEEFFGAEEERWTKEQSAVFLAAGEMYLEHVLGIGEGGGQSGDTGETGSVSGEDEGVGNEGQSESGSGEQSGTGGGSQSGTGSGGGSQSGAGGGSQSGTGSGGGSGSQSGAGGGSQSGTGSGGGSGEQSGTGGGSQSGTGDGSQSGAGGESQSGTGSGGGSGSQSGAGSESQSGTGSGSQSGTGSGSQSGAEDGSQSGTGSGGGSGSQSGGGSQSGTGNGGQSGDSEQSGPGGDHGNMSGTGSGGSQNDGTESGIGNQNETGPGTQSGGAVNESGADSEDGTNAGIGPGTQSGSGTGSGAEGQGGAGTGTGAGSQSETGTESGAEGQSGAGTGTGAGSQSETGTGSGTNTGIEAGEESGTGVGDGTGSQGGYGTESGTGGQSGANTGSGAGSQSGTGTGSGAGSQSGTDTGSGGGGQSGTGTGSGAGGQSGTDTGSGGGGQGGTGTGSGAGGQSGTDTGSGGGSQSGTGTGSGARGQSGTGAGSGTGTGGQSGTGAGNGTEGQSDAGMAGGSEGGSEADDRTAAPDKGKAGAGSGTQSGSATGNTGGIEISSAGLTGELKEIASRMDARAANDYLAGSPFIFLKLPDPSARYIPVPALGNYRKMRYLWNRPKNQAVLASGSRYYEFTLFSNQVKTGKSEAEEITIANAPKIKTVLYVPEDFASSEFGCSSVYLPGSDYAVLFPEDLQLQAEELFGMMMEE